MAGINANTNKILTSFTNDKMYGGHYELVKGYVVKVGATILDYESLRMNDYPSYQYKVRVPCYHNNGTFYTDDELPWAICINPEPSLINNPNIDQPPLYSEGDVVFILFEGGDLRYPIILGRYWERIGGIDSNYTISEIPDPVSPPNQSYTSSRVKNTPNNTYDPVASSAAASSGQSITEATDGQVFPSDSDYRLGTILEKYEGARGDTSVIANNPGDAGGKSYGRYQLASKVGGLADFLENYVKYHDPATYKALMDALAKDGGDIYNPGDNFDQEWIRLAKSSNSLYNMEADYSLTSKLVNTNKLLQNKLGFNVFNRNVAVQEALLCTANQNGPTGAVRIFSNFDLNSMTDEEIITAIYKYKRDNVSTLFASCSTQIQNAVYNRFINEEKDLLNLLGGNYNG